ncbi:hypothetical protein Scep_001647 [Stephania cephalantha]|uniref:Uncharacterized protein n=1 Tax=Stephania cephalantha TaxID=152367 RepID=A0AAP0L8T2_9MAGN
MNRCITQTHSPQTLSFLSSNPLLKLSLSHHPQTLSLSSSTNSLSLSSNALSLASQTLKSRITHCRTHLFTGAVNSSLHCAVNSLFRRQSKGLRFEKQSGLCGFWGFCAHCPAPLGSPKSFTSGIGTIRRSSDRSTLELPPLPAHGAHQAASAASGYSFVASKAKEMKMVKEVMGVYGYNIEHILMVDIIPDQSARKAMNEINAPQRIQLASVYKGEAELGRRLTVESVVDIL